MKLFAVLIIMIWSLYPLSSLAIETSESILREIPDNCNCVAFRLDDVQDYFTREAQKDIIEMFLDENLTLTIGAIGGFLHEDIDLIHFINKSLETGLIEVANHGWNHTEHSEMTLENQDLSLQRTNERLEELFNVNPKTFIPPENSFNLDTISAMKDANLSHISGSVFTRADDPPFPLKNGDGIFHFPQTAFVSNVDTPTGVWSIYENEEILMNIKSSIESFGFSVVVMHPVAHYDIQDNRYLYNRSSLNSIRELLKIVEAEYKIVKLSEISAQEWIPHQNFGEFEIFSYMVSNGDSFELRTSQSDLIIEKKENILSLHRSSGSWVDPLILLLPFDQFPDNPRIISDSVILPTMYWLDSNGTWVVYIDPSGSFSTLNINYFPVKGEEFDIILPMIVIFIVLMFVLLLFYRRNK
jgi:peptidoglycan/xylan/chitin deacetylase (PgdA/CDA1 family)